MAKPAFKIRMTVDDREVKEYFRQAIKRGKDPRPALKKCGIVMIRSFAENFRHEGRPRKWKKLSPNTVAGRRKGSSRVLQDTGRLRMSTLSRVAPGNIYKLSKDNLKMGTNLKIAPYHQWGTPPYTIVPRNAKALRFVTAGGVVFAKSVQHPGLDARPFVMIQDEDIEQFRDIMKDHVVGT